MSSIHHCWDHHGTTHRTSWGWNTNYHIWFMLEPTDFGPVSCLFTKEYVRIWFGMWFERSSLSTSSHQPEFHSALRIIWVIVRSLQHSAADQEVFHGKFGFTSICISLHATIRLSSHGLLACSAPDTIGAGTPSQNWWNIRNHWGAGTRFPLMNAVNTSIDLRGTLESSSSGWTVFKDKLVPLTPCPVHPSLHHHVRRCNDILDGARGTTSWRCWDYSPQWKASDDRAIGCQSRSTTEHFDFDVGDKYDWAPTPIEAKTEHSQGYWPYIDMYGCNDSQR